ncbi:MAG: ECF transporter S component [Candidatus Thorarchaeota archaeon]
MSRTADSLDTRGIVTVAILASLGGSLSTFVGYLGNLINLSLGVPFGAGQFLAGLHVFWLVLMRVLVPRRGIGSFGGLLKGIIELFTGSTHGIVIVFVSCLQGILVDVAAEIGGEYSSTSSGVRGIWWVGAGISAASNILLLQLFYFAGVDILYLLLISMLAFCSGAIFAGYFAWETLEFLNDSGAVNHSFSSIRAPIVSRTPKSLLKRNIPAVIIILFISMGSIFYFSLGSNLLADPNTCDVTGLVDNPYRYKPSDFTEYSITIEAELNGAYTHIPLTNYTGVPLSIILSAANPRLDATGLRVTARDGYVMIFSDLEDVMADSELILSQNGGGLWIIAGNYDGSYWVQKVSTLELY